MKYSNLYKLAETFRNESFESSGTYKLLKGKMPILISAPHSVKHYRNNKEKYGEFMTGVIALELYRRIQCYAAVKTRNDFTDPNYDKTHPYKDALCTFIKQENILCLIDLHIMSSKHPSNIEVGTGKLRNIRGKEALLNIILTCFEEADIDNVIVDKLFTSSNPNTVSSEIHRNTSIPCFQIEINWRLLEENTPTNNLNNVLYGIEQCCINLSKFFDKNITT